MKRLRSKKTLSEDQFIKTVNYLLLFASAFLFYGLTYYITEEHQLPDKDQHPGKIEIFKPQILRKQLPDGLKQVYEFQELYLNIETHYTTIETEFIGMYFVTAYSDEETYSRATASGVEVHYSDIWYEPTTCAIDPRYHSFGELLMIDGKIYIAEDTGGNVKGNWIDVFVETMPEVEAWETGYKPVYAVYYEEHTVSAQEGRIIHESFNHYLHDRLFSSWSHSRNDY